MAKKRHKHSKNRSNPKVCEHPRPSKIILECGEGAGSRTFTSNSDTSFQLVHVTLDTTCLKRPEVLIRFSSQVRVERLDAVATVQLLYELFRLDDDQEPISLGTWLFEKVNFESGAIENQQESFSFTFCECMNYPRYCDYFVAVTPVEIINATATVSNGRIAALSQNLSDSNKENYKLVDKKIDDKSKHPHQDLKEILLVCGQGNGSVVFRENEPQPPVEVAHISTDTTCLYKPKSIINFSINIKTGFSVNNLLLQFELLRSCRNGEPISCGTWVFERTGVGDAVEFTESFDFIYCEHSAPSDFYDYFITVEPIDITIGNVFDDLTVDDARIVALNQSSGDSVEKVNYKSLDDSCNDSRTNTKSPKPKKILLACGQGTGIRTFTSSEDPHFQLAHVTLDASCLIKPMVNIEFSSTISINRILDGSRTVQLRYDLYRVSDNGRPITVGTWPVTTFRSRNIEKSTKAINFTFCDYVTCSGYYEYYVTVTPVIIEAATVTVGNGGIAALGQEV
ncbi:DUF4489 domain-containing protein [Vallitalea okinawensis]|uniref:DUF4489 domain-containing protein n=1 Tax=Vallitalea okinawensis TaxID=2078660 RepID=UPI0014796A8E|nr:DUF4489 domain-containing protein [Vallitalea okinawensis]